MKLFFKNLTQGLSIWLGIVIILGISYFALKARQTTNPWLTDSSPTALYVNNWETLTAAKWNTLVDRFKVYQAELSDDLTKAAGSTTRTVMTNLDINVAVWNSGKILVWFYCTSNGWYPIYRLSIDNWNNYKSLWAWWTNDTSSIVTIDNVWSEVVLDWYTPGDTKNLKIERKNGTTAKIINVPAQSCRLVAKTW